jgi:hypothetical protein
MVAGIAAPCAAWPADRRRDGMAHLLRHRNGQVRFDTKGAVIARNEVTKQSICGSTIARPLA